MNDEPKIFSERELEEIFRRVLLEHHELVSLSAETSEDREALKRDALFLRSLRRGADGVAKKVGYGVITAALALLGAMLLAGSGLKIGGH